MVADGYHFSMHRLLAVLGVLALPLSAATFEASSPHHSVVIERSDAGDAVITVTDLDTNTLVLRSKMKGKYAESITQGSASASIEASEVDGTLAVTLRVMDKNVMKDSLSATWLVPTGNAAEAVSGTAPLIVGGDVKAPVALHRVDPIYTDLARRDRIQGAIILRALIDRTGHIRDVVVLKPLPDGLSEAAADALKQWTFEPGRYNGEPVDVYYNVTLVFHLK
jgi:TonB family protein